MHPFLPPFSLTSFFPSVFSAFKEVLMMKKDQLNFLGGTVLAGENVFIIWHGKAQIFQM